MLSLLAAALEQFWVVGDEKSLLLSCGCSVRWLGRSYVGKSGYPYILLPHFPAPAEGAGLLLLCCEV